MTGYISFIFTFELFVISILLTKKEKLINPLTFFCGLWSFILFLSSLQLYNISTPTVKAYFLIVLMVTCFFVGYLFYSKLIKEYFSKNLNLDKKKNKKIKFDFNISDSALKIYYIISFLSIIFSLIDCIVIIKGIKDGYHLYDIRRWGMVPFGQGGNPLVDRRSFIEESFRILCLEPFGLLVPPFVCIAFFKLKNRKQFRNIAIVAIVNLLLSNIASGFGRLGILYYILCFIFAWYLSSKTQNDKYYSISSKTKKIIISIMCLGALFMAIFTVMRSGSNVVKEIYTYFAMPPSLLSMWLYSLEDASTYTFGFLTFYGIFGYIFRMFKMLRLKFLVPNVYDISYNYIIKAEEFIDVGFGNANAFVTPVYYFYADGGIPFVILASLFFGYIVSKAYINVEKNISTKNFVLYCVIMYGLFVSFMRVQTCIPNYIISIVMVYIMFYKLERKKNNE